MFSFYLTNAFKWLRKQPGVQQVDLARLEYPFLPLLTGAGHKGEETLTLHRLLAEDAEFFVQVLCDVYKPATKPRHPPMEKAKQSIAMAAWRLLESWKLMPGLQSDGTIDEERLKSWITKARTLTREKDRLDIGDQEIGKILYHAPPDAMDKSWPALPVLNLIENLESKHIGRGFALECVNSRGVTSRAPLDGGNLERDQQAIWQKRAKALGSKWQRVKALFQAIADDWESQAKWHDDDAKKTRMRWS